MIDYTKCNSTRRDKYNHCVKCGKEIFDGIADIVLIGKDGERDEIKQRWISGHI